MAAKNYITILGSNILRQEINAVKDPYRQSALEELYSRIHEEINYSAEIGKRANFFINNANIKSMDSLHIACAEVGRADYFLTTDYRLIKSCEKLALNLKVINPVNFQFNGRYCR